MIIQADNPNIFNALNVVASAISSGVLFKYAAIISTVTGKLQGSFLWKVQYRCKNILDLKKEYILNLSNWSEISKNSTLPFCHGILDILR